MQGKAEHYFTPSYIYNAYTIYPKLHIHINSTVVLFSRVPFKVGHAPKANAY